LRLSVCTALAVLLVTGCTTTNPEDPWQAFNRQTFAFNDALDRAVLEPVATAWHFLPDIVESGVSNFFENLGVPWTFANDLLQAKPIAAGHDLTRFLLNSTVGVAGFIDVASRIDVEENAEDFGQTLGFWGIPPGPFLMLPVFGPSNPRDTAGRVADVIGNPFFYVSPGWIGTAAGAVELVNARAQVLEVIRGEREAALDYYVFLRDAYTQNRRRRIHGDVLSQPADEDLYHVDEDL
jgi:phospholipid-binding lipoprotein MlaA